MVIFLPEVKQGPGKAERIGEMLGGAAANFLQAKSSKEAARKQALQEEARERMKIALQGEENRRTEALKHGLKNEREESKQKRLSEILGGGKGPTTGQRLRGETSVLGEEPSYQEGGLDASMLSDSKIAQISVIDSNLGRILQHSKDVALREKRENEEIKRKTFESERNFHAQQSSEQDKEVEAIRGSISKKSTALHHARNAIESGQLGFFSPDTLADITGLDIFRTAKGAQLVTAGKENLLGNMGRVSARANNMWFEQRINSMFPKIGQSLEANLTVQEMLEAEELLDKAYINEYDRLTEEDEKNYGTRKRARIIKKTSR